MSTVVTQKLEARQGHQSNENNNYNHLVMFKECCLLAEQQIWWCILMVIVSQVSCICFRGVSCKYGWETLKS